MSKAEENQTVKSKRQFYQMIIHGCVIWKQANFNNKIFPFFKKKRERERRKGGRQGETSDFTHTHSHRQTLEKRGKAAEDKTVGGIFSRAWNIGLAEPGKTTVKHNNKRNTTVKH